MLRRIEHTQGSISRTMICSIKAMAVEAEFIIDDYTEVLIGAEITLVTFGKKVRKHGLRRFEKVAH